MDKFDYREMLVASASPGGRLVLGAREFAAVSAARERELEGMVEARVRSVGYFRLGELAEAQGLPHTALRQYRKSVDVSLEDDCRQGRFRHAAEAERAARAADRLAAALEMAELGGVFRRVREVYRAIHDERFYPT